MIDATITRDIGGPMTVSLIDAPWLVALAADAKILPIIDADRIEFGRALILQGYDASRALRMVQEEIKDNDGALQMLARHRVAIGALAANYRAALEAIDKAVMDGHVCDDVAWFDKFTTLHDFIDQTIRPCHPAAIGDLFSNAHTAGNWRAIETAPKDGTTIDVWRDGTRDTVYWGLPPHECGEMGQYCDSDWHLNQSPGWICSTFGEFIGGKHNPFTHWMPLPGAPEGGQ